MHSQLEKVLSVALHPSTCDGEAAAAFTVARRLTARTGMRDLSDTIEEIMSQSPSRQGCTSQSRRSPSSRPAAADATSPAGAPRGSQRPPRSEAEQRSIWRVRIRADWLHDFLNRLIGIAGEMDIRFSLMTVALVGRHVQTPSRLEFALAGRFDAVERVDRWIGGYVAAAGFRIHQQRRRGDESMIGPDHVFTAQ